MVAPSGSASGAPELYVGLMSGTSLDGVDAVIADFAGPLPRTLAHVHRPLPEALRAELLALNASGADELHRASLAAVALARTYAAAVDALLDASGLEPSTVRAIGAHGQTVRHRPDLGYSVQLNAPALLAELSGIDVVADFRSRDVAAGGQGAPLVPAFHRIVFAHHAPRAVVNIGGMSNVTVLMESGVAGFDTGPGNALIDAWMALRFGQTFDIGGQLAGTAAPDEALVSSLLAEPFFAAAPPKSTGRDLFTLDWVLRHPRARQLAPEAVLASLAALTARSIADAIERWLPQVQDVVVCGGGTRNDTLMGLLRERLQPRRVAKSDALGVPAVHVEALAFAWLAQCHVRRLAGSVPEVTGAAGPRILGALYPARGFLTPDS
jgi:anhydro-N-acetylmuramic acid kinase